MSNIDSDLERAGEDFRDAGDALTAPRWENVTARRRIERRLWAVTVGATGVLLLALPMIFFRGGASQDSGFTGPGTTATVDTQPPETIPMVELQPDSETVVTLPVVMQLEDPPHLLLEAAGWEMVGFHENTYDRLQTGGKIDPLVFRPSGAEIGEPTLSAVVFEFTGQTRWGAGEDAERIELDGRTVSVIADSILPAGYEAGVEFDNGTLVVVEGFGMDRAAFIEATASVRLSESGDLVITPPPGYEQVSLPAARTENVTRRGAEHEGPDGANVEIQVWSGTLADVEAQVLNRAVEALAVRPATIDGIPVAVTYHTEDLARVFIVGGVDGYVVEIDFISYGAAMTEEDLDALLSSIRLVDLATFEASMPDASITTANVEAAVAGILMDIPVPDGFDSTSLTETGDLYQVGAQVVGAVTCAWIDLWVDATNVGNTEQANTAVEALGTSRGWWILTEMDAQGDYPEVVWEYADAIAGDGTVIGGRVLTVEESYHQALGCPSD